MHWLTGWSRVKTSPDPADGCQSPFVFYDLTRCRQRSDVAEIRDDLGPITINRTDKQRTITIGGNPAGRPLNNIIQDVTAALNEADLPPSVSFRFSGQADNMTETFIELLSALLMGMLLVCALARCR